MSRRPITHRASAPTTLRANWVSSGTALWITVLTSMSLSSCVSPHLAATHTTNHQEESNEQGQHMRHHALLSSARGSSHRQDLWRGPRVAQPSGRVTRNVGNAVSHEDASEDTYQPSASRLCWGRRAMSLISR